MNQYQYRPYYKRHLLHYQPAEAALFVTFRLAGSLPQNVIEALRAEREEREQTIQRTAATAVRQDLLLQEQKRH